jgi:hypothetical protein
MMTYIYRLAMTCIKLMRATVTEAVTRLTRGRGNKRTHCHNVASGIVPVGHSFGRSTQQNEMLAGEEIEEEDLNMAVRT